jgi:uncharacterized GH25 family protein
MPADRRPPRWTPLLGLLLALPAAGHDFWIEPAQFRPAPGEPVPVVLQIGEDFVGESQPYDPATIVDFSVSGPGGRRTVQGLPGADPAGVMTPASPGLYLLGFHNTRSFVDLEPARFLAYLEQEGLEHVARLRQERGESEQNGREFYSRSAKALVQAGDVPGDGHDLVLGYPVELIPLANPYALAPGAALPVEFRYRNQPVANVLVVAFTAEEPGDKFSARTGADGRVMVPLASDGTWIVKAVHIDELPAEETRAEWESFWATLTFRR